MGDLFFQKRLPNPKDPIYYNVDYMQELEKKGELKEGETILNNDKEIGKILIDNEYPFALIKFSSENFDTKIQYKSENAIIKINFPDWIK